MKTDVWFPLYIGDYLSATMHLTTEQHGAYLLLMMAYWKRSGPLPDNDGVLAGICRTSADAWSSHRAVLEEFFDTSDGVSWIHPRIEKELVVALNRRQKNAARAKKAAEARWKGKRGASSNATSTTKGELERCPSPSPSQGIHNTLTGSDSTSVFPVDNFELSDDDVAYFDASKKAGRDLDAMVAEFRLYNREDEPGQTATEVYWSNRWRGWVDMEHG